MNCPKHRREILLDLSALLGLALVYRLIFLWAMPRVIDTADAIHYLETAQHFAAGDFFGFNPKIPVLYPLLGAVVHLFIPDLEWACRMVSFVAGLATFVPVYLLTRQLFGRQAAVVTGIAMALWPWLADYGWRVSTEATAVCLWFMSVCVFIFALESRRVWPTIAAAGTFWALSLTRPEGLFLALAALPVGALYIAWTQAPRQAIRMWPYAATLALLVLVSTLYNRSVTGETTANYRVGFILEEFDWMRFTQTTMSTLTDVIPVMLGPIIMLFLGVGLFMTPRVARRPAAEGVLLAFILTQWFVSLFVLSPAPRYLMAPIIGLTIWAAAGIVLVMRRAASLRWGTLVAPLPLLALVGFMLVGSVQTLAAEHVGQRPRQPREYKTAGIWMRENLEPGLIFTRKPQIAWYAQMSSTGPALEDGLAEALARGTDAGAAYLVVDERYTTAALRPLLDPDVAPDSLEHLATFEDIPNSKVVLYRFTTSEANPAE